MQASCDPRRLAKISIELFAQGRRTVSFRDWLRIFDREFDADFADRLVDQLPEVLRLVEEQGMACTLVNDWCLTHYAEIAVDDVSIARRCNVFNSGGKRPVGLRRALLDDLVRAEVQGSEVHLGIGQLKHAVRANVNDVARGISAVATHDRLTARLRTELPGIPEIQAEAVQRPLLEAEE